MGSSVPIMPGMFLPGVQGISRMLPLICLTLTAALLLPSLAAGRAVDQSAAEASRVAPAAITPGQLELRAVVTSGLTQPIGVTNAGDDSHRLFIVQKGGGVRVLSGGALLSGTFFDASGVPDGLSTSGEQGLLGLAFHPDFKSNRRLYVYYTNGVGSSVIAEYMTNAARTLVDTSTRRVILVQPQIDQNHNGGQLAFGPDGYLYIAFGDGGGVGDPGCQGQDRDTLLGAILRIDIDGTEGGQQYRIPEGNPYKNGGGAPELWDHGLRNPWRFSFDRETGHLWIADVGQARREEVNRVPPGSTDHNFGWNRFEGTLTYSTNCTASPVGHTPPIAQYAHVDDNCSVTGGYVYRGELQRDFLGHYVLGDFCTGSLWTIAADGSELVFHGATGVRITSFGEAESGEIYLTGIGGQLFRVLAPPFTDIAGSTFLDDIMWLHFQRLTAGCGGGKYCPNASILRKEMASFLRRALALPDSPVDYFTDDTGSTHEADINALAHAGLTAGCAPNRFCPDDLLARDQLASLFVRAFKLPSTGIDFFDDDTGNTHEADINRLAAAGITSGCGERRYCPADPVSRGQVAAFLHRALAEA